MQPQTVGIILPKWAQTIYPYQVHAIQSAIEQFNNGSKVVFLSAPTGSGKTLIAEIIRQSISPRAIYVCSSISLQKQFLRDFPNAAQIMGRSNYPTLDAPRLYRPGRQGSLSCADCTKKNRVCKWCSDVSRCPYEIAKFQAVKSSLVCANSYYWLYEANYIHRLSGRDLVIIDECDTLESILMGVIEVNISGWTIKQFGLPVPSRKTVLESWIEWVEQCISQVAYLMITEGPDTITQDSELSSIRRANGLSRLHEDLGRLTSQTTGLQSGNWVYDGYNESDSNKIRVIFRPIRVDQFGSDWIWAHGKRFLLMSATIISSFELAESLGLNYQSEGVECQDA